MRLLKNKEVRGALLWQLSVAVIACSLCFWFDLRAGLTAVVLSLLLMMIYCISTYKRYQRLSSLADDINQVLHGDSSIDFDSYSEGELSMELRGQALLIHADGAFRGDLSWTSEAIGNIVKNCMEHTPEGGRIEIEATETALFSEIIIKDNGTGISSEDLPHIFERFYKGKDSDGKSFGIGLALSRMIITGQGGTVKAENRKPVGAMFTIRFYKGTV